MVRKFKKILKSKTTSCDRVLDLYPNARDEDHKERDEDYKEEEGTTENGGMDADVSVNVVSHKDPSFPLLELKYSETFGHFFAATQDIEEGTKIMEQVPLLSCPYCPFQDFESMWEEEERKVCFGCYKEMGSHAEPRCSKCAFPVCGKECEEKPCHAKFECPIFREAKTHLSNPSGFNYEALAVLRLFCLEQVNQDDYDKAMNLQSLPSLKVNVVGDLVEKLKASALIHDWKIEKWMTMDLDEYIKAMNIIKINALGIQSGLFLYDKVSKFSHSCSPNCEKMINKDGKIFIHAAVDIKKGSAVTLNYYPGKFILRSISERQKMTRKAGLFNCVCDRCQDPTEFGSNISTLGCVNCRNATMFPKKKIDKSGKMGWEWVCSGCNTIISLGSVMKQTELCLERFYALAKLKDAEKMTKFVHDLSSTYYHPNCAYALELEKNILQLLHIQEANPIVYKKTFESAYAINQKFVGVLDKIKPGLNYERIRVLHSLATLLVRGVSQALVGAKLNLKSNALRRARILSYLNQALVAETEVSKFLKIEASNGIDPSDIAEPGEDEELVNQATSLIRKVMVYEKN